MPRTSEPGWLVGLPARLHEPLTRAAAGGPANIALMHILMQCAAPGEAEAALAGAARRLDADGQTGPAARLSAALELLRANPQAYGVVRTILAGLHHDLEAGPDIVAHWSAAFDAAVGRDAAGSVALYSLGNPGLLAAATDEIVGRLDDWGLLLPGAACLDIGCGIGRFEAALAPRLRRIVGIDIAPGMVAAAERATAHLPNVEIRQASGRDLAGFQKASYDLVLAVDSFPYMVQAGPDLPRAMIGEAARVLRSPGRLLILNFSYRGDLDADRADIVHAADAAGLEVLRNGTSEFTLWDGLAFQLAKA